MNINRVILITEALSKELALNPRTGVWVGDHNDKSQLKDGPTQNSLNKVGKNSALCSHKNRSVCGDIREKEADARGGRRLLWWEICISL